MNRIVIGANSTGGLTRQLLLAAAAWPLLACGHASGAGHAEKDGSPGLGSVSQALLPTGVVAVLTGASEDRTLATAIKDLGVTYPIIETQANEQRPGPGAFESHRLPQGLSVQGADTGSHPLCIHAPDCLAFIGYSWPEPAGLPRTAWNDRFQVLLSAADASNAMRLDQWRYVRLYVSVGTETEQLQPGQDVRIFDLWQSARGTPYHPPGITPRGLPPAFSIKLKNGTQPSTATLEFSYNNDAGTGTAFWAMEVGKGDWHSFHIAFRANPIGSATPGAIQLWVDQGIGFAFTTPHVNGTSQFFWGFNGQNVDATGATCTNSSGDCVKKRFDIRAGLVRTNTLSGSGGVPAAWVYLDSVKVTEAASVMPYL